MPDELRRRAKNLIRKIFEAEHPDEFDEGRVSFGNSMLWAGDRSCPNVVALAEEVARDIRATTNPRLHGWRVVKDRMQLLGCGILVVLLMLVVVILAGIAFHWK